MAPKIDGFNRTVTDDIHEAESKEVGDGPGDLLTSAREPRRGYSILRHQNQERNG